MGLGLFEKLTGHFINGMPIDAVSKQTGNSLSIMDHLQRLFNSKIGSPAIKVYGFPATFADIHTKVPENVQGIEKAVVTIFISAFSASPGEGIFLPWETEKRGNSVIESGASTRYP
jgi:hypothetical protein